MVLIESDGEEGLADDGGESSCCGAMRRLNTVMNMAAAPEHLIKLACLIDIFALFSRWGVDCESPQISFDNDWTAS